MDIEFICLANSWRESGRCVAGIRTDGAGWIRPVSATGGGRLTQADYTYDNGQPARVLDVIRVSVAEHSPLPHQPENWTLEDRSWVLIEKINPAEAGGHLDSHLTRGPALFGDLRRYLEYETIVAHPVSDSLALVEPEALVWQVNTYANAPKPRASFTLSGADWNLPVTDPEWTGPIKQLGPGTHPKTALGIGSRDRILFAISLAGPMAIQNQNCYKLIAGIVRIPR